MGVVGGGNGRAGRRDPMGIHSAVANERPSPKRKLTKSSAKSLRASSAPSPSPRSSRSRGQGAGVDGTEVAGVGRAARVCSAGGRGSEAGRTPGRTNGRMLGHGSGRTPGCGSGRRLRGLTSRRMRCRGCGLGHGSRRGGSAGMHEGYEEGKREEGEVKNGKEEEKRGEMLGFMKDRKRGSERRGGEEREGRREERGSDGTHEG